MHLFDAARMTARSAMELGCTRVRCASYRHYEIRSNGMRPVLLWILGIPIPIIILLYLFNVL